MMMLGLSSLLFIKVLSFYLRLNGNALTLLGMSLSNPIKICADRHRFFFFFFYIKSFILALHIKLVVVV